MKRSDYEVLQIQTNNMALVWKESRGIAPDSVADKLDDAMLKWMAELTDTLKIWIDKGSAMTDGELILARTNMGALVESWLKFFYCVFYEDYKKKPLTQLKKGKTITVEPNNMKFEDLKNFIPASATFTPNPDNKAVYDKNFEVFKVLYKTNKKNFKNLNG